MTTMRKEIRMNWFQELVKCRYIYCQKENMKKFSPKEKAYIVVKRGKVVKISIVTNLPELLDKLKIHSLTIISCIMYQIWYNLSSFILDLNEFVSNKVKRK